MDSTVPEEAATIYTDEIPDYSEFMTVEEYRQSVKHNYLTDYDGEGCPARGGKMASAKYTTYPSIVNTLPKDATHIVWFNR